MSPTVPLSMALTDFFPNLVFLLGVYFLYKYGYRSVLFMIGSGLVFLNGMSKAVWKLIVALAGLDITWLSQIFIILLPTGFLVMLAAVLIENRRLFSQPKPAAPVLMAISWKIPFMMAALVGAVGLYGMLIARCWQAKRWLGVGAFAVAMVSVIVMSSLSGGDFDLTRQWTAQGTNALGQTAFAVGAWVLSRKASSI